MAAASAPTPTGPAAELVDDGEEELAVHLVEAVLVHLEERAGVARDGGRDHAFRPHLGEVAHAAEEAVRDARRAAAAPGDLR